MRIGDLVTTNDGLVGIFAHYLNGQCYVKMDNGNLVRYKKKDLKKQKKK